MGLFTSLFWLPFLLVPLLLLFKKKTDQSNKKHNKLPPSPPKLPIIGNLHQLGELSHSSLSQLARKYGPVMLLHLGRMPVVVVSSADAAKEVLKVNDLACCSRPKLAGIGRLTYDHLDVAFSPYSECWRELRKICVLEIFSMKRVKSFRFIREEEIWSLMNSISRSSTDLVNVTEKVFVVIGSIIFRTSFGKCFYGSEFDHAKFDELVHDVAIVAGSFSYEEFFPGFGWIIDRISGHNGRVERVFQELDTFFQQAIDDHLKPGRAKHEEDIIDVMLGIENEQIRELGDHAWLTKNHIKAVLMDMFLGGIDTSSLTVIWAMTELVRNPTLMKKAQDEVRGIVGKKGRVEQTDLDQLHYNKLIIKETLRLHPPAPLLITREAISHFRINNYDICPGTLIQINAWAIGRDSNYWKNPEEFSPERFIGNNIDFKGQDFELLPFGGGRRVCPGLYMGTVTVELLLANLLYCFDWCLTDGMKETYMNIEEQGGQCVTVNKKTPLLLMPVKYLDDQAS
ncbi:hypothetical protein V6N11_034108 [Hibiscus sabdariffa]|uniref:Cytochrome P450 n=1 Tax=Hibiscus sabdariffa TaxID=183260 RepID=A0ABR2S2B8_9ROSI